MVTREKKVPLESVFYKQIQVGLKSNCQNTAVKEFPTVVTCPMFDI